MDQLGLAGRVRPLILDDAETFKEVGMQDDLLFYAPSSGRSASSSSALRFIGREQQERRERGRRLRSPVEEER